MKKKIISKIKLNLKAESANPAPPVGSSLGVFGINIMDFCKQYNSKTKGLHGVVPAHINIFSDKSFSFKLKLNPVSELIKSFSSSFDGKLLSPSVLLKIASTKISDLNTINTMVASKIIWGTLKNTGILLNF
jgi:large subunit ribosomal protein L11